jgi:hypothetical protein
MQPSSCERAIHETQSSSSKQIKGWSECNTQQNNGEEPMAHSGLFTASTFLKPRPISEVRPFDSVARVLAPITTMHGYAIAITV